jgi:hypothetical protein
MTTVRAFPFLAEGTSASMGLYGSWAGMHDAAESYTPYDYPVGWAGAGYIVRDVIRFNLSDLPADATITDAYLRLHMVSYPPNRSEFAFHIVSANVGDPITTIDYFYENFGTESGGSASNLVNPSVISIITLNSYGRGMLNARGETTLGIRFKCDIDDEAPVGSFTFGSTSDIVDPVAVSTTAATNITYTSAVLHSDVIPWGSTYPLLVVRYTGGTETDPIYPRYRFKYYPTGTIDYSYTDWVTDKLPGTTFSASITGLMPGTFYDYRTQTESDGAVITESTGYSFYTLMAFSYPSEATARVTSLIHRYSPGNYTLELNIGEIVADFGLPVITKKPTPAIPPANTPWIPLTPDEFGTVPAKPATPAKAYTCPYDGMSFDTNWEYTWHMIFNHNMGM